MDPKVIPMPSLPSSNASSLSAKALVFEDPRSQALLEQILAFAPDRGAVLITGERGTGRKRVARYIHELSPRALRPFLAVSCRELLESRAYADLFGEEPAGASAGKGGSFQAADGGTLFLDAVVELPGSARAALLGFLETGTVTRLGSNRPASVDVRLIVATDLGLEQAVAAGNFCRDLYDRLDARALFLPPLRERRLDILPLARHFLEQHRQRLGIDCAELSEDAATRLLEYPWPGNIRELERTIHHALLCRRGLQISSADLRLAVLEAKSFVEARALARGSQFEESLLELFEQNPPHLYERIEEAVMRAAFRYCERNQVQTARLLGISRNIVRARLIHFGQIPGTLRSPRSPGGRASSLSSEWRGTPARTVRIGYQRVGLLKLVRARGRLESELRRRGLRVEWAEFPGGVALVDAFRRGEVGLGIMGEGPPVIAQAAHVPIVYLAAEAPAPEGEAIIVPASSSITSVAELAGKQVALSRGANVHYLLIRALEEAQVDYTDVRIAFMAPAAARVAFAEGRVDAWAIGDPMLAEVEHALGARVVRDAKGLAANPAYYVATQAFVESHPEVLDALLSELSSISRWASEHLDEVVDSLAPRLGIAKEALSLSLRRSSGARLLDEELILSQQRVADSFFKLKLIPRAVSVTDAVWPMARARAHQRLA